jgi:hypothetical protein
MANLGGVFLVVKCERIPIEQPAQVAYPPSQYFLDQGDNSKSCRPSHFTWYCFLNSDFNSCPYYDSYVLTDSLSPCCNIWSGLSL